MPVNSWASAAVQPEGQHRLGQEVGEAAEALPHLSVARRLCPGRLPSGGGQARPPLPLGHQIVCRQGRQHPFDAGPSNPQPPRPVGRAQPPALFLKMSG